MRSPVYHSLRKKSNNQPSYTDDTFSNININFGVKSQKIRFQGIY